MNPANFRLVVTAGPTREWLDPVRFITNASSGRTGFALARHGLELFKEVVYISGPVPEPYAFLDGARNVKVETTADLASAVSESLTNESVLVMSAAPADYTPETVENSKIKKSPDGSLTLTLKPTTDVLSQLKPVVEKLERCYLVGFAAETNDVLKNASGKLKRKNLDFICANQVFRTNQGFGSEENTWLLLDKEGGKQQLGPGKKDDMALELLNILVERL